ncbi:Zinc finger protein 354C [Eumeta japonica]|uniref:Zinc finger protein 354C n=1 Tax=Eumeta variegata TaxID=151549 RepID=A0A4C1ZWJ0_EUMVA|nr:Zinc finger protein 354C [Eumeta japonica]
MEAEKGNIQKCSEQIWNWYLASCAGDPRVVGEHHKPEIRDAPRVPNRIREFDKGSVAIKIECEDPATTPELAVGHINLLENFVTGFGLLVEEQMRNNVMHNMGLCGPVYDKIPMTVRTERADAVTILEPNAGHAQEDFVTIDLLVKEDNDEVIKIEDESDEESWIKQDLEIGPTVLQPTTALRPLPSLSQMEIDLDRVPCPVISSGCGAASAPLCTASTRPELRTEVENNHYSVATSNANFVLDVTRTDNVHQIASSEQSNIHSDTQSASIVIENESQSRHYDVPAIGCNILRATVDVRAGGNEQVNTLKKSIFTHHVCTPMCARRGIKPYKCDQCEYRASRQIDIVIHMRTHTGEKPFKCDQCEFRASHRNTVKNHMRTHSSKSLYECGQCQYSGHKLSDLKKHMHTHTGEKLYKCRQCEYRTSDLGHLKIHICSHTGEKLFKCEQCEYRSVLQTNLKRHMRIHTGEKPYQCEHCGWNTHTHVDGQQHKWHQCGLQCPELGSWKRHVQEGSHINEQCNYSASVLVSWNRHTYVDGQSYKCEQCDYSAPQIRWLEHMYARGWAAI